MIDMGATGDEEPSGVGANTPEEALSVETGEVHGAALSRRPSPQFSVVLVILAVLVAYVGVSGLGQGLRAARGEGAPGVFTMTSITCVQHPGHESCTCNGTFTGDAGEEPRSVYLHAAGRDTCVEDASIPAGDVGASNRVYGPDGSREWILSVFILVACAAVIGGVAMTWVRHLWATTRPRSGERTGRNVG